MKIRDLRQYIRTICGDKETLEEIGTDFEFFLKEMNGKGQKLNALITGASSFASNAKEQLFYEFVQNAYDAKADSLFFYANEEYLIVLNNGEPFYTDLNIFEKDGIIRDGQLYNFLAKGKSLKIDDETKLGKYGQGSKLLYTLLADVNNNANIEELLKDSIIKSKKGPYLISWNDMSQLDALMINGNDWIPAQADDVERFILFAKILMSYYPIAPGQALSFFSNEEAQSAIKAFETLVNPKRNKFFLKRGTALIIPLGKGKYESIVAENNLENVRDRLGSFASITGAKNQNETNSLQHIYVMGKEVDQHPIESVFVEFEDDGRKFEYHFAFNQVFAEKNVVNLFKGLPILQSKYRLGFIIDSQIFEVDDSRQRISDFEKTSNQLIAVYSKLLNELDFLRFKEKDKFDFIYKSLIASRPGENTEEEKLLKKAFYEVFRPFLDRNALTLDGEYVLFDNVFVPEKEIGVKLSDLGINDKFWIEPTIVRNYKRHFSKEINVYSFSDMLRDADKEKMSFWIKSLSRDNYNIFHRNCLSCIDEIPDLNVFLSDKGNLYSWEKIKGNTNIYYSSEDIGEIFAGQEYIIESMKEDYDDSDYISLFNKIKSNIESFRNSDIAKETACNILNLVADNNVLLRNKIRTEILLLKNWNDDYKPFCDLISERPDNTILFDNFCVKGYIPNVIKENGWLADKNPIKNSMWNWLLNNFEKIKQADGWGEDTERYLNDIRNIYNITDKTIENKHLNLYLNNKGIPVNEECFIINCPNKRLNEEDYNKLKSIFPLYNFVPFKFEKDLNKEPFNLTTIYSYDLIEDRMNVDFESLRILINITDDFLRKYRIIGENDSFQIMRLNGGNNYFNNEVDLSLRQELVNIGFFYVPEKTQSLFHNDKEKRAYNFVSNDELIFRALESINDRIKLFPIIRNCNADVIKRFFQNLPVLQIDYSISENDLRWQIIRFGVQSHAIDSEYKAKIFTQIKHKSEYLPETIKVSNISAFGKEYNIYDLNKEYQEENLLIDTFLDCLPTKNDSEWFKDVFYKDKTETVTLKELYDSIKDTYLSVEQLKFCLDYSINGNPDYEDLEIDEEESLTMALDMILEQKFIGFDKYFKIRGFENHVQAYASCELLLEVEKLPEEFHSWLDRNSAALSLFENIRTENDRYINLRKCLLADEDLYGITPDFSDEKLAGITLEWLITKKIEYKYFSTSYNLINKFIDKIPEDYEQKFFLRYTGDVISDKELSGNIYPLFILCEYQENSYFLSPSRWLEPFREMLMNNRTVQKFFKENTVFLYEYSDLLSKHNLNKVSKLEITTKANDADYTEFKSPAYEMWKKMPESKGILIKISKQPIGISFNLQKGNEKLLSIALNDRDFGYEHDKTVIVQYPNSENLKPLKMIKKHIRNMEFFKEPFIELQGLLIEQMDAIEEIAEEKGLDIESLLVNAGNILKSLENTSSENFNNSKQNVSDEIINNIDKLNRIVDVMDSETIDKLGENVESIKEIVETFDNEEIQKIADKKDKIIEVLYDMEEALAEDETQESLVRQTIGYIGELIYGHYLESLGKEHKYAALEGVGDYDFHNITNKTYIDVKTTLYSLKDGTAPFYLHKSQNLFMQKYPDEKYRIVRISLNDLNLKKEYERIRDTYGKEANPLTDERLDKACRKLAKKYWQGASIKEFDAVSHEYAIRIEKR